MVSQHVLASTGSAGAWGVFLTHRKNSKSKLLPEHGKINPGCRANGSVLSIPAALLPPRPGLSRLPHRHPPGAETGDRLRAYTEEGEASRSD